MVFRVTNNGLVEMSSVAQPIGDAQSTSQEHNGHQSVGPPGVMRNTFRHPRPCGECSAKKVKCIPLPSNASLCVRCVSRGLPQCPPHVPWSARRGHTDTRSVTRDSQDTASAAANHQHSRTNSISSTSTQSEYASTQYGLYYTPENTIDPSSYASGSDLTSGAMRPDYGSEPTGGFMLPYTYSADPAAYNLDEFAMQTLLLWLRTAEYTQRLRMAEPFGVLSHAAGFEYHGPRFDPTRGRDNVGVVAAAKEVDRNELLVWIDIDASVKALLASTFSSSPHLIDYCTYYKASFAPLSTSINSSLLSMDSFAEPSSSESRQRADLAHSLDDVNTQIRALEQEYEQKGITLSGRTIHVTHYLPLTAALAPAKTGVISPPLTPPIRPTDVAASPTTETSPGLPQSSGANVDGVVPSQAGTDPWILGPRWGHSAMISGIQSLSAAHEQLIVGWVGDLMRAGGNTDDARAKVSVASVSEADRAALDRAIAAYQPEEDKGGKPTHYVPIWLDDGIAHGHYDGYCKTTLWPLFHYLLWQDVASESASADEHWREYVAANRVYAEAVASVYKPGDLVWVHDYHLLLVPQMLRALVPDAVTGLFVHTPFPSSEIFRCLPRRDEILDGMLGANLVCFQTYSYSRHFTSSCIRVLGYETTAKGIDNQGYVTTVSHCAVGVDALRISKDVLRPGIQPKLEALRQLYEGKKIIVARDKLDVVKGVVQKLRAFERLLQDYPEWIGNVVLIQVTSPALTDSPKLERQVSELVAHINGDFGALDFVPVHHYHQTIKKDEFYALLSVADLAVITPLRDGMNTTSMEFVLAQERTNKSPLVLSEFMGISSTMSEALQVNPWDLGGVAAAINRGLLMPEEEKHTRHAKLYKSVTTQTSHTWAAMLVRMLLSQMGTEHTAHSTPFLSQEKLHSMYIKAQRRLFLFDYDGTLTPIVKTPSMAVPSPEALEALEKLSADPRNVVYIISGRDSAFLEQHLGHVARMGMSAEHGGFMRAPGEEKWSNLTESLDMSWMSEVEEIFKYYTERTTGSHIEIKKSSITLFQCHQCQDLLENNLAHKRPIEVLVGKKNLEVRPLAINKGEIVKRILYAHPEAEFVFCAGDDKTDEDMFRALAPFTSSGAHAIMDAPLGVTPSSSSKTMQVETPPVELALSPDGVFSTAVGASSKKTLASWHVSSPHEVVERMLGLVNGLGAEKSSL
ncbi:hypothetical protein EW145_g216 [Phellinidium pouzarii]|uniref:Uncharacterized protein n=1 Tax=Phellinidium pouzarii TaxID=167371 RepID=A0A4S4LPN2_9AGAM|nr:hypothetical protein EW145_g216 [Phellinidium pouzarii]